MNLNKTPGAVISSSVSKNISLSSFGPTELFESYKLIHYHHFGTTLKAWINESHFSDLFRDWESLMEAVEKIELLGSFFTLYPNKCVITCLTNGNTIEVQAESRMDAAYYAVVEFYSQK